MNVKDFSTEQCQAFLDLLVLAMYADGQLHSGEDERVEGLLTAMGFEPGYDQQREFDAAVTRVRKHSQPVDAACAHAADLAARFTTSAQRRTVFDLLNDLVRSDNRVSPGEQQLLASVKQVFQM
jgi:uncharacterized tellurite resistance protein B-like protein